MAKKNGAQAIMMWILMAMLIAGLGGFGIDSFLGGRVTSIGAVGDRQIPADAYARALQAEMRGLESQIGQPVTLAMAQGAQIDQQVRAQLITEAALDNEADRIGISVGDQNVQRSIVQMGAFQGPTGAFDMETYRFRLQNNGMTPAEFEEQVRRDAARSLLQAATAAGIETPDNLRAPLMDYYATRHRFDIFTLTEAQLSSPLTEPDEAAIQAYYDANLARFTTPETRHITFAWLTPDMVLDSVEVNEATIRSLYDERIADYIQPERRLVERLVFGSEAEAQAAMDRLTAGEASFEELVTARGLSLDDADMGDVSEAQLSAAGAAVFALEEPGQVVGPLPSNLGPALFRMNAILNAQETTFEEARDELRAELAGDAARRAIQDQQESLDDLLAGGATLEDLAAESAMQLGEIDWNADVTEGIAAYTEFAAAAASAQADDFPELAPLSDGGLFALRLDRVTPPAPQPLDAVRVEAAAGAREEALNAALATLGQEWSGELASGGVEAFSEARGIAAETLADVTRLDPQPQIPPSMMDELMAGDEGTTVLHVAEGRALLALIGPTEAADTEDAQTQQLTQAINQQMGQSLAQDVFTYFARALQAEAGITLNQAAIDAVHTNFR
ncbi:SurA N-terminal domain-containing protein [Pararhodobacter aggregans]|uniref:SurA N-terminal domain-containing protein n=1 Tax=Pararhodobacter aggregans TaxID=404875 RepID=UPI003A8FDC63